MLGPAEEIEGCCTTHQWCGTWKRRTSELSGRDSSQNPRSRCAKSLNLSRRIHICHCSHVILTFKWPNEIFTIIIQWNTFLWASWWLATCDQPDVQLPWIVGWRVWTEPFWRRANLFWRRFHWKWVHFPAAPDDRRTCDPCPSCASAPIQMEFFAAPPAHFAESKQRPIAVRHSTRNDSNAQDNESSKLLTEATVATKAATSRANDFIWKSSFGSRTAFAFLSGSSSWFRVNTTGHIRFSYQGASWNGSRITTIWTN